MQTSMLTRALLFIAGIVAILALIIWGVGLETIKARQVDLIYLGQQHLILVFSSMFFLPCWSVFPAVSPLAAPPLVGLPSM